MENLAPPLRLMLEVINAIENGESIRLGVESYLKLVPDDYSPHVAKWFIALEQQKDCSSIVLKQKSLLRRRCLELIKQGLEGKPILPKLRELEEETIEQCHIEIENYLATLPFKTMIPLLLFQFPAFLLLLLGPLFLDLIKNLGGQ